MGKQKEETMWGNKLWLVLREKGMKQKDFAKLMGFSGQRASQVLNAIDPPEKEYILRIAEKLEIPPERLGYGKEDCEQGDIQMGGDDADRFERIIEIAKCLDSGNLKMLYVYAVYLESKNVAKKNIREIS